MSVETRSFTVVSMSSDSLAITNKVYVSKIDLPFTGSCIKIDKFIFLVEEDQLLQSGTIALNSIQRREVGATIVQKSNISLVRGGFNPKIKPVIIDMAIELRYVPMTKKGGEVDVMKVSTFFTENFGNQCFCLNQNLTLILSSIEKFVATISKLEAVNSINDIETWGEFIAGQTTIIVTANKESKIQLNNIPDAQLDAHHEQDQILKKFDLENLGIGGLSEEFRQLFRRAFVSRILPPSTLKRLGIQHIKGVLLWGPAGTGKTLIARKIGEILQAKPPKIVSGPELFDKYVGGTEANVRKLFEDAENDQNSLGERSPLHLIILDEFDSICKQRGSVRDNTGVADNVVNQLLSKIDGVNTLNNVLLIGMTNRKDLLDDAILRPGRFEVHIEVGLPDELGRVEIFRIHTRQLRENGVLAPNVDCKRLAHVTPNYSGAEIAGVVRSAVSFATNKHINFQDPTAMKDLSSILVTMQDFQNAIQEVKPAFGQTKEACDDVIRNGIINHGAQWETFENQAKTIVEHFNEGGSGAGTLGFLSVLIEGTVGSGKSAVAAHIALSTGFPYIKFISPDSLVSFGELQKANVIRKTFEDAYRSKLSVVVLDDIERLIEYSHVGGRYSNLILQTLLVLVKKPPPLGKKILVFGTTSSYRVLESLELTNCFSASLCLPEVNPQDFCVVARALKLSVLTSKDEQAICGHRFEGLPMKVLITAFQTAAEGGNGGVGMGGGGGGEWKGDSAIVTGEAFKRACTIVVREDKFGN